MHLGTAKFIQLSFENLTCIGGNCFDVLWVRQLTLIGTSHDIQYFMHGTDGLINNGEYHGFKMWATKYLSECLVFANYIALLVKSLCKKNASCIGTQEVEGLDVHFFNGKLHYKIFAAGITWAPGLTSPATAIFRSCTTPTSFFFVQA